MMENETTISELRKAQKGDATRERVRKFRAAQRAETPAHPQPPISTNKRVCKYRLRKQREALPPIGPLTLPPAAPAMVQRSYLSAERTRKYRQRNRERHGYLKAQPLTKRQRDLHWHSKKQQLHLKSQMVELANGQLVSLVFALIDEELILKWFVSIG